MVRGIEKFKEKLSNTLKENALTKHGQIKTFDVECEICHTIFQVQEHENDFPSKLRYFCSITCAHSYSGKQADPHNISFGVKEYCKTHSMTLTQKEVRKCKWCDSEFETTNKRNAQCCSPSCSSKYREFKSFEQKLNAATSDAEKIRIKFRKYRLDAAFTFSLKDFPDEFDFSLIETSLYSGLLNT